MGKQAKPAKMASVATIIRLALQGQDGRNWYDTARADVIEQARRFDVSPVHYANVLSIFSPRVQVVRNRRLTEYYFAHGAPHESTMQATRAALAHYVQTGEIRGPKTGPFARACMGDQEAIVLDVWMAAAFRIDQEAFSRIGTRREAKRRIREAARRIGWTPAQVQAAVWTQTVRNAGRNAPQMAA